MDEDFQRMANKLNGMAKRPDANAGDNKSAEGIRSIDRCPDCGCDINGPSGCLCEERVGREDYYRRNGW